MTRKTTRDSSTHQVTNESNAQMAQTDRNLRRIANIFGSLVLVVVLAIGVGMVVVLFEVRQLAWDAQLEVLRHRVQARHEHWNTCATALSARGTMTRADAERACQPILGMDFDELMGRLAEAEDRPGPVPSKRDDEHYQH